MDLDKKRQDALEKIAEWRKGRKASWVASMVLFWGGVLFGLLDLTTPLPTAVRGEFAFVWLAMMFMGGFWWVRSRKLPVEEILELARLHDGRLIIVDVVSELGISIEMARRALDRMVVKGFAVPGYSEESQTETFDFPGLRNMRPAPSEPPERSEAPAAGESRPPQADVLPPQHAKRPPPLQREQAKE
jgi:hypothetical protein